MIASLLSAFLDCFFSLPWCAGKTRTSFPQWTVGICCWTRWGGRVKTTPRWVTSTWTMSSCASCRSARTRHALWRRLELQLSCFLSRQTRKRIIWPLESNMLVNILYVSWWLTELLRLPCGSISAIWSVFGLPFCLCLCSFLSSNSHHVSHIHQTSVLFCYIQRTRA